MVGNNRGVTQYGFIPKTLEEIISELNNKFKSKFGEDFDISPENIDGQIIGIFALELRELWLLAESVFNSYRPGAVEGIGLDNICELSKVTRYVNVPSRVTVECTGNIGTLIPEGCIVSDGRLKFKTDYDIELPGFVTCTCTEVGENIVLANTVNKILTNIPGWNEVNNPEQGITGIDYEKDPILRNRRDLTTAKGYGYIEAIQSALTDLHVKFLRIRDNDTDKDIEGQPPGTLLVVVEGGDKYQIAKAIFEKRPLGTRTFGNEKVIVKDIMGFDHPIYFSRTRQKEVYVKLSYSKVDKSTLANSDIKDLLEKNIINYVNNKLPGSFLIWSHMFHSLLEGIRNIQINNLYIGFEKDPSKTETLNLFIDERFFIKPENIEVIADIGKNE